MVIIKKNRYVIVPFLDNKFNQFSNTDSEIFNNKITILKKIKSLRQLKRTEEKELVRLYYK